MSLEGKVQDALKKAMIAKDQVSLRTLRAIKAAVLLIKTEKGFSGEVTDAQELATLQKMVKQRREAMNIFETQGRTDLAEIEKEEIAVIERFLPEQLAEDEIKAIVKEIVEQTNASSMKDMGKVIGIANQKIAGRGEGATIANIVKSMLQ